MGDARNAGGHYNWIAASTAIRQIAPQALLFAVWVAVLLALDTAAETFSDEVTL
jgi:hypothetical protein